MLDPMKMALSLARTMVMELDRNERTPTRFRDVANQVTLMLSPSLGEISVEDLLRRLEAEFEVWVPHAIVVSDPAGHVPWLDRRMSSIDFAYWSRYKTFLAENSRWKPGAIEALDESTGQILSLMEDPSRPGSWKTYGLVYGQVQSGKTASYTGVISKAVDAGYQVVIVLTSQHESLRHQTQARLDSEFLGFNTKFTRKPTGDSSVNIGVGAMGLKSPDALCMPATTRDSDFTSAQFQGTPINVHEVRVLVVAKKNSRILRNIKDWLSNFGVIQQDGRRLILNAPLLLIDDEADYASVDTRRPVGGRAYSDPDHDPTAINKGIRNLLELFEKRAYLAYTATPFANIFIAHTTEHPEHGEDLFPRSFMLALEPPSNYCGPEVVFGLEDPSAADIREPLPILREVADHSVWMPDVHAKGFRPPATLPPTLIGAIDAFVLSTAIRKIRARDHDDVADGHNTMLVHVTRYTDVQGEVARQIEEHLRRMSDSWGDYGDAGRSVRSRLRAAWKDDFVATYSELSGRADVGGLVGPHVAWGDVVQMIPAVLKEAARGVRRINGTAADVLDYQSTTPVTVVAVGGDKLSRGLTLEGLTVSYYLRASRTYDTLLQMGRWFGYRHGYLDVTRLYTTQDLINNYVHITRANRELMDLTGAVARAGKTPKDVGLQVLDGVGNLQVTAATKMRSTSTMLVTYSAERAETLVMRTDRPALTGNYTRLEQLLKQIAPCADVSDDCLNGAGRGLFKAEVPAKAVLDFLCDFAVSPRVLKASPTNLVAYIEAQLRKGELTRWTVAVTGGSSPTRLAAGGLDIPLVRRKPITGHARVGADEFEVGVLVSPAHEAVGMSAASVEKALHRTADEFLASGKGRAPVRPSGESLRHLRPPTDGVLIVYPIDPKESAVEVDEQVPVVGYAVVFPHSDRAEKIRYRVNQVFLDGLLKTFEDPEDVD